MGAHENFFAKIRQTKSFREKIFDALAWYLGETARSLAKNPRENSFAQIHQNQIRHVIMEASSQGLDQRRLDYLKFQVAVFTNLLQTSQGTAVGAQDEDFTISGIGIQSNAGTVEVGALTIINPDGVQLQTTIGEEDLAGGAIITLTGIQVTAATGGADGVSVADATGSQLQSSISGVTLTGNAVIDLTGIQLTGSLGSINITPWNEVDLGVNNTWTEVDLAA